MSLRVTLLASLTASLLACSAASAQESLIAYDPVDQGFGASNYFEGFYAGVIFGFEGNDYFNIFAGTATDRIGAGVAAGWQTYITPHLIAGGEVRTLISSDFGNNTGYDAFVLGRLGALTSDNFMVYAAAGPGVIDGVPTFAFGQGAEWRLWDNITGRIEVLGVAQTGTRPAGTFIEGVTAWSITGGLMWHFGEGASYAESMGFTIADLSENMDFGGLYAGASFGGTFNPQYNFFPNTGHGWHLSRANFGAFIGWNGYLTDGIIYGGELQADLLFDTSGDVTHLALGLGRLGVQMFDRANVYAAAGAGVLQGKTAFALGGGVEYALFDNASLRGEVLGLGELSANPVVPGFSAVKMTMGTLWHFD